ncbi:MAG TPA: Uma2 family endonuclease [Candidatus Eremiobacteraceae bacterium]|nr:Uma2 family endonuclease [Candidatus Eremiobacteraceae bacterium]
MQEIVLPDSVKPALEWVNNRILQKVSPARKHAIAQGRFFSALDAWANGRGAGTVGTEWRFQVAPPGEIRRSLVPDVGYLSYDRMPLDEQVLTDSPAAAPDALVEVLSPDDRTQDIEEKIRVYLAAGTNVVFLVDTKSRTVEIIDRDGRHVIGEDKFVEHDSLPGLHFIARDLFDVQKPQRSR